MKKETAKSQEYIGFGFDPLESKHHFLVVIPPDPRQNVLIYERFEWGQNEFDFSDAHDRLQNIEYSQVIDQRFDRLKCDLNRTKWQEIEGVLKIELNQRIKSSGAKGASWKTGQNPIQRLLGKELTLLCWAIEDSEVTVIPTAIRNWQGLKPEERWWLYTMTNASTGDATAKYGWRTAIRYALTENPITEKYQQRSTFDKFLSDTIENYPTKK